MTLKTAQPYNEAVRRLDSKSPVAASLRSDQWAEVPLALRERALFSSRVNKLQAVEAMGNKLRETLEFTQASADGRAFMDRSKFIAEMRKVMARHGLSTGKGDLADPGSRKRLGLIYDFQVEDAFEYGRWKSGQSEALRRAYPARELLRIEGRRVPRNWRLRWVEAGGRFYGGRMVALKDSPIWTAISRFGRPWPPFDFGSGMGVAEIDRDEAIDLGVIEADAPAPASQERSFNDELEASVRGLSGDAVSQLKDYFGDQVVISGDRATWLGAGRLLREAWDEALANPQSKGEVMLGQVGQSTREAWALADGVQKSVHPDTLRHIHAEHGQGNERGSAQRPITAREAAFIDAALDAPEKILPAPPEHQKRGEERREHVLPILSLGELHVIVRATKSRLSPVTVWLKKSETPS